MKTNHIKSLLWLAGAAALVSLSGCGNSSSSTPSTPSTHSTVSDNVVLTANTNDSTLSVFNIDTLGTLTKVDDLSVGYKPTDLIIHPNGKFLIVMNSASSNGSWDDNGSVGVYSIGEGGLTLVSESNMTMALNGAITPNGKYIYITNQNDFEISAFSIDSETGALTELSTSPYEEYEAHSIVMHPSGKFFFVGSEDGDIYSHIIYDENGSYSENTSNILEEDAFNWLAVTPNGEYLYAGYASGTGIYGYGINQTDGNLTILPGFPILNPASGLKSSTVTPSGKYIYFTSFDDNNVTGYAIGGDGSLTLIDSTATGTRPKSIDISSDSMFAYVANYGDNNVSAYSIETNGSLTAIDTYDVGDGPKRVITGYIPW
ncbi:MAG TPA: beta-propeller fold lactonase family protein [Sulfurovum sp.]|uniref:lactonase family protein n=1 Tax=Sulfurovum sp. TaxID=1969726 RepID=UPI002F943A47